MIMALIAAGAVVGAPARYLVDQAIQRRRRAMFPWGTLAVNVAACLVLGAVAGAGSRVDPSLAAFIGTGFAGTLSTYSTFSHETMRLNASGERALALANVVVSVAVGLGAAALGWSIGGGLA